MKKLILTIAIAISGYSSYAQWTGAPGNIYYNTGTVGIGITNPSEMLTIKDPNIAYDSTSGVVKIRFDSGGGGGGIGFEKETFNTGGLRFYTQYGFGSMLEKMRITATGNVGIGTGSPIAKLQVAGQDNQAIAYFHNNTGATGSVPGVHIEAGTNSNDYSLNVASSLGTPSFFVRGDGNVGIGTKSPAAKLHVIGNGSNSDTQWLALIDPQTNSGTSASLLLGQSSGVSAIQVGANNNLTIQPTGGNVLIGQTTQSNPAYKLDVKGKTRADEIVVNTSGADFVFDKKYTLPKLSDVKAYIDKNQHLPEIPSAKEMQTNGMSIGEINTKLLQKVEELTLYIIEKDKQLTEQNTKLTEQQIKNNEQEARIAALEKTISKLIGNPSK